MKILAVKDLSIFEKMTSTEMLGAQASMNIEVVRIKDKLDLIDKLELRAKQSSYIKDGVFINSEEKKLMLLVREGHSNKRIAKDLAMSEKEVRNVLLCFFRKIGVKKKSDAIRWFLGGEKSGK